jgi:endonuclease/exonuclease/phosphatase family metal-dependent hydrolase
VHLTHGRKPQAFIERSRQYEALVKLVGSLQETSNDSVLVLGDFNTHGQDAQDAQDAQTDMDPAEELELRATMLAERSPPLYRLPNDRECTAYYGERGIALDHAFVTHSLRTRLFAASVTVAGLCRKLGCDRLDDDQFPNEYRRISDHCPIVVPIRI